MLLAIPLILPWPVPVPNAQASIVKPIVFSVDAPVKLTAPTLPDYDKSVLIPLHAAQAAAAAAEAARQAEVQRQADIAAQAVKAVVAAPTQPTGSCSQWLAAAGITDVADAMILINMESGCNPLAVNPTSGACGVAQELPCGKSGCTYGDGACEVSWMNQYTLNRYGSWANAVAFHEVHGWY